MKQHIAEAKAILELIEEETRKIAEHAQKLLQDATTEKDMKVYRGIMESRNAIREMIK